MLDFIMKIAVNLNITYDNYIKPWEITAHVRTVDQI
jgi:hypothetical protein